MPEVVAVNAFPPALQESISNIIKEEGFLASTFDSRKISTEGANYMGDLYEVDIKGETVNGRKEINLFVKLNVSKNAAEAIVSMNSVHECERYFYKELSNIFKEMQDKASIPPEDRLKVVKSYDMSTLDAIIMENMAVKNYKIPPRMEVLPLRFAELSVQQLAKLHGLSIVLQRERPEYYSSKLKTRKYPIKWSGEFKAALDNFINLTINNVDKTSGKIIDSIREEILYNYGKSMGIVDPVESSIDCLCHGDYRHSNILMQQINDEVTDVIPVDYQTLHHGCPINDLIYLIYSATDRKFRQDHMQNLKDMYYDNLKQILKYFKFDIGYIFPRKKFERIFKEKLNLGLSLSVMWLPIIFVDGQDAPDLGTTDMAEITFKPNEKLAERVKGALDEFIELGYISPPTDMSDTNDHKPPIRSESRP